MASLLSIPRRTAKIALGVVLLLVVLFFGLTRTQVGRNQLRNQIEQQFDDAFAGRLDIGRLEGNLVNDLYASDVRLFDPDGRLVLRVDSVVARPRWGALFDREISLRAVTLYRPHLQLRRGSEGGWNVADALRRPDPREGGGAALSLTLPDVRLVDGRLVTQNTGPTPNAVRQGWLFDYADAQAQRLNAHAALEWQPGAIRQVDLLQLSGTLLRPRTRLEELRGQLVRTENGFAFNDVTLETAATSLRGDFAVSGLDSTASDEQPTLDLELASSRLDWDEIRQIVPRVPLSDQTTVEARIQGPLSSLVVNQLTVRRGASRLEATGTVLRLPEAADFEVALSNTTLEAADVGAVYPEADLSVLERLGRIDLNLSATGVAALRAGAGAPPLRTRAQFTLRSPAGGLQGEATLNKQRGRALAYTAGLNAERVDLARFFPDIDADVLLNGRVDLDGQGTTRETVAGDLRLRLAEARLAGRRLQALSADFDVDPQRIEGTLELRQDGGALAASGTVDDWNAPRPAYRLRAESRALDLGPLLLRDSLRTQISAQVQIDGAGAGWDAFSGAFTVAFDTSQVLYRGTRRLIPTHTSTLTARARGAGGPRLRLESDIADLTVDGRAAARPARALAALWGGGFRDAVRHQIDKPYAARAAQGQVAPEDDAPAPDAAARARAAGALQSAGLRGVTLTANLHVKRPAILTAFVPALAPLSAGSEARLALSADADSLHAEGTVTTDTLRLGRVRMQQATTRFEASASLRAPLAQTLRLTAQAEADTLSLSQRVGFARPVVALSFYDRAGELQLATGADAQAGPLRLEAGLQLLDDRNRLRLRSILLETGSYAWTNPTDRSIDLYADAVDIPGLLLVSQVPEAQRTQTLRLRGTLSSAPGDTVTAEAGDILLSSLSNLASLQRPFGGLLNGRVALTGGLRRPELTGSVDVQRLSFDRHLLGRFEADSRYVPGSPAVALDARLSPTPADTAAPLPPADRPHTSNESALRLSGTFQLPGLDPTRRARYDPANPGALDLTLDVERADAFFFQYLFSNVLGSAGGALTGTGTVQGTFPKPRFEAELRLEEGAFSIPQFGLTYGLEGPVIVDQAGIHLRGATLTGGDDGSARVGGSVLFNNYEHFSFDLDADLDELKIIDVEASRELPFYGDIRASGPVTLRGPIYNATLRAPDARTTPGSELYIPISENDVGGSETGYIIFADSTGQLPNLEQVSRRRNLIAERPAGERSFLDGLNMDVNVTAPQGSIVHLVFDPLLGDEINAVGGGRLQLLREEGAFSTYGTFEVTSGDYLFTAGELFQRRFQIDEGTLTWDGPPANARLDLTASYRTRASTAGLTDSDLQRGRIPLVVLLDITERVAQPQVSLSLAVDRSDQGFNDSYAVTALETILNQGERETEYATSVLLTNTFLLTTDLSSGSQSLSETGSNLAFNSVSQLVASQLNRYLSEALPGLEFNLGVQGEDPQDLDVIYGVALRLLDDRLLVRGEGIVPDREDQAASQGLEGEFVVEMRLSPNVSLEAFYRREGSILSDQTLTNTTGAGISYQTQFPTWRRLVEKLFGWLLPGAPGDGEEQPPAPADAVAAGGDGSEE